MPLKQTISPYLGLLALLLLTACVSAPPIPEERFYRLPAVEPAAAVATPIFSGTLAVGAMDSAGIYRERALLHSSSERPTQLLRYHYRSWTDAPPRLLQDHLIRFLREANAAPVVITDNARSRWQHLLNGKLRRFERVTTTTGSSAVVEIEFQLFRDNQSGPLLVKDYTAALEVEGDTVDEAVTAFASGLSQIYQQLLADLQLIR